MTEQLPIPLSRADCYLATAAGMTGVILPANGPQSREEDYLAYMAGDTTIVLPTPGPLKEQWLAIICGDTSVTTPEIKGAFLIGQQMVRVEFLAKAAGIDGVVLPTDPNRTEQYFANIGGIVPDPGVLTQAKGTYIVLNNVLRGIDSLNYIYGDTYQQTYSGKNLMPMIDGTVSINGITATIEDGILTLNGTATLGTCIKLTNTLATVSQSNPDNAWLSETLPTNNLNGKTISLTYLSGTPTAQSCAFRIYPDTSTYIRQWYPFTTNQTYTWTANTSQPSCFCFFFNSGVTFTNYKVAIQLETGSSATAYEPYVGGIPSPNPDYPQDIQVVTGEQTITISDGVNSDDFKVHLTSKNLLQYTLTSLKSINSNGAWTDNVYEYNGITYTVNDDLTVNVDGVAVAGTPSYFILDDSLSLDSGTNYILNGCPSGGAPQSYSLRLYDSGNYTSDIGSGLSFTYGTQNMIRINIYAGITVTNKLFKPMVRLATVADDSYQEYYDYKLAKIGNYQDKIFQNVPESDLYNPSLDEGDWYVHKENGRVVLDSSSVTLADNYTNIDYGRLLKPTDSIMYGNIQAAVGKVVCSCSIPVIMPVGFDNNQYIGKLLSQPMNKEFWIGFAKGTGLSAIKTALNGQIVYYALATPTDTKITDATLISELEAVGSAVLPTPDAFIQVTGNLAGEIEISYYAKSEE